MLLAPASAQIPSSFARTETDWTCYWTLLHEMQRLRGQVYLQDGAIDKSCLIDGRHQVDADFNSWHLLVINGEGRIRGCARFHEHPKPGVFSELNVSHCALARNAEWSGVFEGSLRDELHFSNQVDLPFVELGGWALHEEIRGTTEALRIAFATYAFWQMMGEAVCVSTVTHRHCAASMLRRIGGRSLSQQGKELPTYFDPQYNCNMELLKFYTWAPNPRFSVWIKQMKEELANTTIVSRHQGDQSWLYGKGLTKPFMVAHGRVA